MQPTSATIMITESKSPDQVLSFAIDSGCRHICQKNGHSFDQEVESAKCLEVSERNLLDYPVSTILSPANMSPETERSLVAIDRNFNCSSQKNDIVNDFVNAMQSKGLPRTLTDDVIAVADELFTNAVFNAPFVDIQTHRNPGLNRHGPVQMTKGKSGRIFLGCDQHRLVVGCHDPYGSLQLSEYLKIIRATYQKGAAKSLNFGAGGAGLGSYIIFNAGSSLYVGVWPGQATVFCCVIPLGLSNRRRTELVKHFHWVQR
jgi:hypothetical protein